MKSFGITSNGMEAHLYTLENEFIRLDVTDYAFSLVSCIWKKTNTDVLLGYRSVKGYEENHGCLGAIVGRVCNRIGDARFTLNNHTYTLGVNNGPNNLHSGPDGYHKRFFDVTQISDTCLIGFLHSADGDQGYPGNLDLTITYELKGQELIFSYEAKSDQDTLLNITNHAYWNLDGSGTILNHSLQSNASSYIDTDANGLPTGPLRTTDNTVFDFQQAKTFGKDIDDSTLSLAIGYDHPLFVDGDSIRQMAVIEGKQLQMIVSSDLPGYQLYTANHLTGHEIDAKNGIGYEPRSGFCIETQFSPDAINRDDVQKPILHADEVKQFKTIFQFNQKDEML